MNPRDVAVGEAYTRWIPAAAGEVNTRWIPAAAGEVNTRWIPGRIRLRDLRSHVVAIIGNIEAEDMTTQNDEAAEDESIPQHHHIVHMQRIPRMSCRSTQQQTLSPSFNILVGL